MFLLDYQYDKEYYKHHSFILISRCFDLSHNWLYTAHIYKCYEAYKNELIDKDHYEAFKTYIEFIKHSYND